MYQWNKRFPYVVYIQILRAAMPATMLHFIQQCLSKYWSYAAWRESFIKRNVSGKKSTRKYNGSNFSWTMEAQIIRDEKVKMYQEIILQKDKFLLPYF